MEHQYFMKSERIGFKQWKNTDLAFAEMLWGNPNVARYVCANGCYTKRDVQKRLNAELQSNTEYKVQYWMLFELSSSEFIGCCGLHHHDDINNIFETGYYIREEFWGKGFATEAEHAAIQYAFDTLKVNGLWGGHHPQNIGSRKVLLKQGFQYLEDVFYEPTGLYHPCYYLENKKTIM